MVLTSTLSVLALALAASATAVDLEQRDDSMYWEVEAYAEDDCSGNPVFIRSGTNEVGCTPVPSGQTVNSVKLKGQKVLFGMNDKYRGSNPPTCYGWNTNIYPNEGACQQTGGARNSYWIWEI